MVSIVLECNFRLIIQLILLSCQFVRVIFVNILVQNFDIQSYYHAMLCRAHVAMALSIVVI